MRSPSHMEAEIPCEDRETGKEKEQSNKHVYGSEVGVDSGQKRG